MTEMDIIDDIAKYRENHLKAYEESVELSHDIQDNFELGQLFMLITGGNVLPTKRGNLLLPRYLPAMFFRGENTVHDKLQASIYRDPLSNDPVVDEFIKETKIQELGLLTRKLRRVQIWEGDILSLKTYANGVPDPGLYYDVEGIAQHYGLATHYLDFTNNIDVALFFACTRYDDDSGKYEPLDDEFIHNNPHGVLYSFPVGYGPTGDKVKYDYDRIRILPVQPFSRSYCQSGFAYYDDLGPIPTIISKHYFNHDPKLCREIFDKFHGGRDLFPDEGLPWLSDEVKRIRNSTMISESAFRKTCTLKGYHKKMARSMRESIEESGFSIGPKPWTISEIELSRYDCDWSIREYFTSLNYNPDISTLDFMYPVEGGKDEHVLLDSEFSIVDYVASLYTLLYKRL